MACDLSLLGRYSRKFSTQHFKDISSLARGNPKSSAALARTLKSRPIHSESFNTEVKKAFGNAICGLAS
jgi:hypothetical protein